MESISNLTKFSPGSWEEGVESVREAKHLYEDVIKDTLEKLGIPLNADTKILEIGSGSNVLLKFFQGKGHNIVGVDARPRGGKEGKIVAGRIEQLPFQDETFDLIISNSVFDDIVYNQDQLSMVKEMARVLKKGGVYFGMLNSMANKASLDEYFETFKDCEGTNGSIVYRKK